MVFKLVLLLVLLISFANFKIIHSNPKIFLNQAKNMGKGFNNQKKWVATPINQPITTILSEADNSPWFADYSSPPECVSQITGMGTVNLGTLNKTSVTGFLKGGVNTAVCLNMYLPSQNRNATFAMKVISSSIIYDLDFGWHCGDFRVIEAWPGVDKNKPDITNGISCKCPGSLFDAQFTPCEGDNLTSNFQYYRRMPWGDTPSELTLCHSLTARGAAKDCWVNEGDMTDYFMKLKSTWDFFPVFNVRRRVGEEYILGLYVDGVLEKNISLSALDPVKVGLSVGYTDVSTTSMMFPQSALDGFTIFSQTQNFTNVDDIFVARSELFNWFGEFSPYKLCPIKAEQGTPVLSEKYKLEDAISQAFMPERCENASGTVQVPFPRLRSLFNKDFKFSNRFDPMTFSLQPGESSVLKQSVEASVSFQILFDEPWEVSNELILCTVTSFSFFCDSSINLQGFKCTFNIVTNSDGQIYIKAKDSENVLANWNARQGTNNVVVIVDPMYVSDKQVTLCAGSSYNADETCHTIPLNYTIDAPTDAPHIDDPNNDLGDNHGGGIIFGSDGGLKSWAKAVISIVSIIVGLLVLYLMWPVIMLAKKGIVVVGKKLRDKMKKASNDIEVAHSNLNSEEVTSAQKYESTFMPTLR